jgi:hypothetical protein
MAGQPGSLAIAPVTGFSEDARGDLWVSLFNNGIYRIVRKSVVASTLVDNLLEPVCSRTKSLKSVLVTSVLTSKGECGSGQTKACFDSRRNIYSRFSPRQKACRRQCLSGLRRQFGSHMGRHLGKQSGQIENGSFKTFLRTQDTYYPTSLFEDRNGRFWIRHDFRTLLP